MLNADDSASLISISHHSSIKPCGISEIVHFYLIKIVHIYIVNYIEGYNHIK